MVCQRKFFGFFVFFVFAFSVSSSAQPVVTGTVSNVTRVESWSYFQPAGEDRERSANPDYTFFGDRAELGVTVAGGRFDLTGAFNYVRLENLPTDAIGPGGLGSGAFYFAATGVSYSYQLYLGELTARFKSADQRTSFTVGRMPFASGVHLRQGSHLRQGYGEQAGATGSALERLTKERLASRLIGNFEWSYYQRRFDGARFDLDRDRRHFTAAALVPTQGGYEESTNLSMPNVQVATVALTGKAPSAEWQLFASAYRDRREEKAVVDNTFSLDAPVDVTVATVGASHARVAPVGSGEFDTVVWIAAQAGDWYGRTHRASSIAVEAGHRWTTQPARPWLRAGYLWASGDRNGEDQRHGTFFQMLPSSRKYALSSAYAHMNLRDAFAQLLIEPRRLRARIEVHALHLASGDDLWYQGSGATASHGRFFGFSGRAAHGDTSLGTVIEGAVDVPIRKHWSVNAYAGTMSAGDVVQNWFTDKRLVFWSVENVIRF